MKNWNSPVIRELNVKLTASGYVPSTDEANGYLGGTGYVKPTHNSATHEWNQASQCCSPIKTSPAAAS